MHIVLTGLPPALISLAEILTARGHEVQPFSDPASALRYLEDNDHANALLIVDQFAEMPGVEISWEARLLASPQRPLYIGLVSRPLKPDRLIEALDCGVDDVLQMPLCADELYARLRAAQRLTDMQLRLVQMATVDGLTGLLNRRAFFQRGERLLNSGAPDISATMVDIDHFKRINDTYGHAAGDTAIRFVAAELEDKDAIVGRLGGEEFAVLRGNCTLSADLRRSEALRQGIESEELVFGADHVKLSCSFGVATRQPHDDIDGLLRKADLALYAAKASGRNRVVAYDRSFVAGSVKKSNLLREISRPGASFGQALLDGFCPHWPVFAAEQI